MKTNNLTLDSNVKTIIKKEELIKPIHRYVEGLVNELNRNESEHSETCTHEYKISTSGMDEENIRFIIEHSGKVRALSLFFLIHDTFDKLYVKVEHRVRYSIGFYDKYKEGFYIPISRVEADEGYEIRINDNHTEGNWEKHRKLADIIERRLTGKITFFSEFDESHHLRYIYPDVPDLNSRVLSLLQIIDASMSFGGKRLYLYQTDKDNYCLRSLTDGLYIDFKGLSKEVLTDGEFNTIRTRLLEFLEKSMIRFVTGTTTQEALPGNIYIWRRLRKYKAWLNFDGRKKVALSVKDKYLEDYQLIKESCRDTDKAMFDRKDGSVFGLPLRDYRSINEVIDDVGYLDDLVTRYLKFCNKLSLMGVTRELNRFHELCIHRLIENLKTRFLSENSNLVLEYAEKIGHFHDPFNNCGMRYRLSRKDWPLNVYATIDFIKDEHIPIKEDELRIHYTQVDYTLYRDNKPFDSHRVTSDEFKQFFEALVIHHEYRNEFINQVRSGFELYRPGNYGYGHQIEFNLYPMPDKKQVAVMCLSLTIGGREGYFKMTIPGDIYTDYTPMLQELISNIKDNAYNNKDYSDQHVVNDVTRYFLERQLKDDKNSSN